MKYFIISLVLALNLSASQYATIGATTRVSVATGLGTDNSGSIRYEGRINNYTYVSNNNVPIGFYTSTNAPYCQRHSSTGLACYSWADTATTDNPTVAISLDGRTDFYFRFQRDVVGMRLTLEIWDADGTDYVSTTRGLSTIGATASRATFGIDGTSGSGDFHHLKAFSTIVELGAIPVNTGTGDIGDWEFEGNLQDTSGNGRHFTVTGAAPTYGTSPTFYPYCSAGSDITIKAGANTTLDGTASYPLNEGTITYNWQQLSGPSQVRWRSSRSLASPTFNSTISGEYAFRLTVTDNDNVAVSCDVTYGSVHTDSKGVVVIPNAVHAEILGPMLMLGSSSQPWSFFDEEYESWATLMASGQGAGCADSSYCAIDDWNTELAGTISISTAARTIVTGVGTDFQNDFCGGDTTPDGHYIVLWSHSSDAGRFSRVIASCDSATQITLSTGYPWLGTTDLTNAKYSKWSLTQSSRWINQSTNVNYYDAVMAFYALYYQTGRTKWLTAARWLADKWWSNPTIDKGWAYDTDGVSGVSGGVGQPRMQALTGMWMRAYDDPPEDMFAGLAKIHDGSLGTAYLPYRLVTLKNNMIVDIREEAFLLKYAALCALYSPDAGHKDTCKSALATTIKDRWYVQLSSDGVNRSYWGLHDSDTLSGSMYDTRRNGKVTMVNGSTTVLLNVATSLTPSPTWLQATIDGKRFITSPTAAIPDLADQNYYTITWIDANTGELDRPYAGTSGEKFWAVADGWIGFGIQPFMLGIYAKSMHFVALALEGYDATAQTYAVNMRNNAVEWLKSNGQYSTNKGLSYGVGMAGVCIPNCITSGATDYSVDRYLQGEIAGALSLTYLETNSASTLAFEDTMFSGSWAKYSTDLSYDGTWLDLSYSYGIRKHKEFGFQWGFGGGNNWPAARIGGLANPDPVVRSIYTNLSNVANATQVRITPTTGDPVVCVTDVCDVTIDSRRGADFSTVEYLSASDVVLRTAKITIN